MTHRILVFDTEATLPDALREALGPMDPPPEVVGCSRTRALGDFLGEQRFDVLVAGPGLDTRSGWERLRVIREEVPEMVLVLALPEGADPRPHDVVRAGAVEVLDVPVEGDAAIAVIARALTIADRQRPSTATGSPGDEAHPPSLPKRVLTVASASGGCGKTFLATNLAWLLHHHGRRRVCIVDLDLQFGEVSSALRLRPRATIVDLVQVAADGADMAAAIEEHCEVHDSGIAVLAAPRDPTEAQAIDAADVGRVIDAARRRFDDVIVDTPAALTDTVVAALNRSDELLLLATLDVPSVRNLHTFLGSLERLGVERDGIRLLLNKAETDAGIDVGQILKLFPQGIDATLPYDRAVLRSLNAGQPVLSDAAEADISRRLQAALLRLLPPEAQQQLQARRSAPRGWGLLRRPRRVPEAV